jgi:two-component system chemotaxis sensor kinase CheA
LKLGVVCETSDEIKSKLLSDCSQRLINILETTAVENKGFPPDDAQTVAYILEDMSSLAMDSSLENDGAVVKQLEKNIKLLEENISTKEVKTGEILKAKGILSDSDVEELVVKQKESGEKLKFGQVAVKEKKVSAAQMAEVLKEQQKSAKETSSSKSSDAARQIRISVTKVDNLLDMLGELIILNSQLDQQVEGSGSKSPEIANTISRTSKIIRSVQDLSMSLRLIQIKNTLFRLTRVIRDTANELNKKVNIAITGDDIEIDRSAAEKIFDPLMHLVRNSVSHGIESAEERIAAGKPVEGKVEINAFSKRGSVYIEVKDDGKGIDPEKVFSKAVKLGLADPNTEYSESEKINFIMQPGFSMQKEVNNISGRGVGMNVVESELMKIGGKVDIENKLGEGCSFILRIPMNLALVNGTIVDISGENYIIPTLFIKQFYIKEEDEWISMQGQKRAIKIRDNIIPIITEETIFNREKKSDKERKQIIILEMEKHLLGLPVDNIVGRQDIVSKPLDSELAKAKVLSGASILGDGKVSLILDVEALYKLAGY